MAVTLVGVQTQEVHYFLAIYMYEPRLEKTGLPGFRPGPTLTRLYSHR